MSVIDQKESDSEQIGFLRGKGENVDNLLVACPREGPYDELNVQMPIYERISLNPIIKHMTR